MGRITKSHLTKITNFQFFPSNNPRSPQSAPIFLGKKPWKPRNPPPWPRRSRPSPWCRSAPRGPRGALVKKYVNIPSEKYIYVHIYMCVYVYIHTYVKWMSAGLVPACHENGWVLVLCWLVIKMDEYRSYAGLSSKWMSTGLMLACHKNGWVPVLCWLVIKLDEYRSYAGLSSKWMSTGLMLACHQNGWVPVLCWLVIKMDEYRSCAGFS